MTEPPLVQVLQALAKLPADQLLGTEEEEGAPTVAQLRHAVWNGHVHALDALALLDELRYGVVDGD